ncbi:MAG: hypothetical protein LBU78_08030 [Microbacterium sp.]|nr:hypothetical protein [Microbacterium sp.]
MPYNTPSGKHPIEHLDGKPDKIQARGTQITELGEEMNNAWTLINRLVEEGADMEGEAIDKLREVADEVSGDLGKGGELYAAVGPHIKKYGDAVATSQPRLNQLADDLEKKWREYYQAEDDASSKHAGLPDEPDSDAEQSDKDDYAKKESAANAAASHASTVKGEWDDLADDYDREWNTWHTAYETAVHNIKEGMSGKIKDSWSDNFGGWLSDLADVLTVLGLVFGILALIFAGPFVLIGAVIAGALLAVQAIRFARGEATGVDLAFAIVGCIPFIGPAGRFFKAFAAPAAAGARFSTAMNTLRAPVAATFGGKVLDFTTGLFSGKGATEWGEFMASGTKIFDAAAKSGKVMGAGGWAWAAETFGTVSASGVNIVSNVYSAATGTYERFFGDIPVKYAR